jgi:SET domain-containing protein
LSDQFNPKSSNFEHRVVDSFNRQTAMKTYRSLKIEVRSNTLSGRGVVAIEDIEQDEIVAIKSGHIVRREELGRISSQVGDLALQIDDDFYLTPTSADEVDDMSVFINHSCDPNVGFLGQVTYVAMREIRAGEELCHDYSMERSDDYFLECHCGSPLCRHQVTGDDWKLAELQSRYGQYFSIYILKKINAMRF